VIAIIDKVSFRNVYDLFYVDFLHQVINVSVVPLEILHKPLVVLEDFTLWFI